MYTLKRFCYLYICVYIYHPVIRTQHNNNNNSTTNNNKTSFQFTTKMTRLQCSIHTVLHTMHTQHIHHTFIKKNIFIHSKKFYNLNTKFGNL